MNAFSYGCPILVLFFGPDSAGSNAQCSTSPGYCNKMLATVLLYWGFRRDQVSWYSSCLSHAGQPKKHRLGQLSPAAILSYRQIATIGDCFVLDRRERWIYAAYRSILHSLARRISQSAIMSSVQAVSHTSLFSTISRSLTPLPTYCASAFLLWTLAAAGFCSRSWAQTDDSLTQAFSLGAYHARGDFGADVDTRINYLPLSYELSTERWTLMATASRLEVTGLGNVLVNVGGVTQAVAGDEVVTQSGLGDTVLSALYHFDPAGQLFFDLRIDAKLPSADERKALGTGEIDVALQLDLSANVGSAAVFASLGYNKRGKTSLYPGLLNSLYTQLGFAKPLGERLSVGALYDFRQSASEFSTESHELTPYLSWQLSPSWSFTALTVFGFTDASPDTAVMGQLRYSWSR